MIISQGLERCRTFIDAQMQSAGVAAVTAATRESRRAVTISRQTGSGAHSIAEKLAVLLQARSPIDAAPWTVFDRNLVEKVLEDHHLPQRLAQFMPEDRISELKDTIDELIGLHPPSWTLVRQTADTILRLVELGNVIVIGRGATIITGKLDHVFHVRLVGSMDRRAKRVQELEHLSEKEALALIRRQDRGRERYLKKYFHTDLHDPLLYHLVINTDKVSDDEAARLIADAVLPRT